MSNSRFKGFFLKIPPTGSTRNSAVSWGSPPVDGEPADDIWPSDGFPVLSLIPLIKNALGNPKRAVRPWIADIGRARGDRFDDFFLGGTMIQGAPDLPFDSFILSLGCTYRDEDQLF